MVWLDSRLKGGLIFVSRKSLLENIRRQMVTVLSLKIWTTWVIWPIFRENFLENQCYDY
jgi:hypothetical protein